MNCPKSEMKKLWLEEEGLRLLVFLTSMIKLLTVLVAKVLERIELLLAATCLCYKITKLRKYKYQYEMKFG